MFHLDKKKIVSCALLLLLFVAVFFGGMWFGKNSVEQKICTPSTIDFSLFWDAYNKLHQTYIDPSQLTNQNVVYGAISGMTASLGDPFTEYFDPTEAKLFESDLAGSFSGIGVEVAIKDGALVVVAPLKGTPSEKAGLKPGDIIEKIDGKTTSLMSSDDAVDAIRGKSGTTVTLTIVRVGWSAAKNITITRATINVPSVSWKLEDGDVAYIQMYQFDQTLSPSFKTIAAQILASPAKKIVLDLRGNPGGYLETAQDIAGYFLPSGQVVTIEDFGKGKPQQKYLTQGNAQFVNYPMVVLIDGGSASAAEILSGALRDDRGIKLVGEQSFGKGSVQEVVGLMDNVSFLKITIAHWLTPKGASISGVGLTPDVIVAIPDTTTALASDPQLAKALEIVNGLK